MWNLPCGESALWGNLCGDLPCGDLPCGDLPCGDLSCGELAGNHCFLSSDYDDCIFFGSIFLLSSDPERTKLLLFSFFIFSQTVSLLILNAPSIEKNSEIFMTAVFMLYSFCIQASYGYSTLGA